MVWLFVNMYLSTEKSISIKEREDLIMVEKFIKDYADVRKNDILVDDFISKDIREKAIEKIDKTLKLRERGIITRDEAISMILNCFE